MNHTYLPYIDRGDGRCRFCGGKRSETIDPEDYGQCKDFGWIKTLDQRESPNGMWMIDVHESEEWMFQAHYPGMKHDFYPSEEAQVRIRVVDLDASQARVALFEITGRERWWSGLESAYKAEKARLDQEVLDYMAASGRSGEVVDGHTLFPTVSPKASIKSGMADELRLHMEAIGEGHLYKTAIDPRTLTKWVKEQGENAETLEPDIPEPIRECLNIFEVKAIGIRKK